MKRASKEVSSPTDRHTDSAFPWPVFAGLVLFAMVLRGPFVVVSTVTGELTVDLGMTAATVGLLTSLPVLCFGLGAPAAARVIGRLGVERAILVASSGVLAGVLIRSAGGIVTAFAGTLVIGLAITIGNVVSPVLVGRDFRARSATVTGSYTAGLNVGSMLTLSATGPLVSTWGWRPALAVWAVLPILAGLVWIALLRRRAARGTPAPRPAAAQQDSAPGGRVPAAPSRPAQTTAPLRMDNAASASRAPLSTVMRRPSTWLLTVAFAGQAFAYYGLTAWLPTLLADEQGMTRGESGAASSIFQVCALIGAFATPVVINRLGGALPAFLLNGTLWASLPLGLLFAPDQWALWSALGGVAQGGGFVCIFTVVVLRARTLPENRQLSAVVQTGGYTIACLGPVIIGGLHERRGGWPAPLLAVVAAVSILTVLGALSTRGIRR